MKKIVFLFCILIHLVHTESEAPKTNINQKERNKIETQQTKKTPEKKENTQRNLIKITKKDKKANQPMPFGLKKARTLNEEFSMEDVQERLYAIEDKIDHLLLHAGHDIRDQTGVMTPFGMHYFPTHYNDNSLNSKLATIDYIFNPQMRMVMTHHPTSHLNFGHDLDNIGRKFWWSRYNRRYQRLGMMPSAYNPYYAALGGHYLI